MYLKFFYLNVFFEFLGKNQEIFDSRVGDMELMFTNSDYLSARNIIYTSGSLLV